MDCEIAGVLEQRCRGSPNCGESERNQICWISADETNETWQLVFLALSRLSLFVTTAEWHLERRRSCSLVLSQNSTEIEFVGLGEWRVAVDCRSAGESRQIWSAFAGHLDQDLLRSSLSRRSGEASVAV